MFEGSLIESVAVAPRRTWATGLSFALQMLLLSAAVMSPLLYTDALPKHALSVVIEAPPPPPAAPAPRAPEVATHHTANASELNEGKVMLPRVIPKAVKQIYDEPDGPPSQGDGVVGAPPGVSGNGVPNAVIADMLHTIPAPIAKSIATKPVRVSSGVAEGLLIHQVKPQYPALARSARVQGGVVLQAVIGKDGTIQNLHLLSGHPLLVQAAMDAVRQWRYRPYMLNSEPVEVDTTIQVNFTLAR